MRSLPAALLEPGGGISASPDTTLTGTENGERLGTTFAAVGDLSGDGFGDVAFGYGGWEGAYLYQGRVVAYEGSATGLDVASAVSLEGPADWFYLGNAVAGAGDVNGDGADDLLVGTLRTVWLYDGHVADRDGDGTPDAADCAPKDDTIHPGAVERCDGDDDDCDGDVDEDAKDALDWYADGDGDGYGTASTATTSCSKSSGYVDNDDDCDDDSDTVFPGATEILGDGIDQDCDGSDSTGGVRANDTGSDDGDGTGCGGCASSRSSAPLGAGLVLVAVALRRRQWSGAPLELPTDDRWTPRT
jgi:hypothetical protein